ncbi:DUF378 domain-containing protein [Bhargavaea cecembensis]|uniref:DUF378 domain-containing protein n=1 Tax=Bhargavaea cecembensis TaxID=394098 RepID=UPI0008411E1D|nr:DUF378 domain-containing protein [Bhargavaea cecembensis]
METFRKIALAVAIIGALNWGLEALLGFDIVADLSGGRDSGFARFLYGLIALAGVASLGYLFPGGRGKGARGGSDEHEWQYRPPAGLMEDKDRTAPD